MRIWQGFVTPCCRREELNMAACALGTKGGGGGAGGGGGEEEEEVVVGVGGR